MDWGSAPADSVVADGGKKSTSLMTILRQVRSNTAI